MILKEPKILIMLRPLSFSFSVILNPSRPFLAEDEIPAPPDTTDPPPPPLLKHNTPGQKKEKEGTLRSSGVHATVWRQRWNSEPQGRRRIEEGRGCRRGRPWSKEEEEDLEPH